MTSVSGSLRIVDYDGIIVKIKKIIRVSKHSAQFPKVERSTNQFVSSRILWGVSDRHHCVFLTPFSETEKKSVSETFVDSSCSFLTFGYSVRVDKTCIPLAKIAIVIDKKEIK